MYFWCFSFILFQSTILIFFKFHKILWAFKLPINTRKRLNTSHMKILLYYWCQITCSDVCASMDNWYSVVWKHVLWYPGNTFTHIYVQRRVWGDELMFHSKHKVTILLSCNSITTLLWAFCCHHRYQHVMHENVIMVKKRENFKLRRRLNFSLDDFPP